MLFLPKKRVAGVEHGFLVSVSEPVKSGVKVGNIGAFGALQRVQVGPTLAHVAVGGNELLHGSALAAHFDVFAGHDHFGAASFGAFGKSIDDR